MVQAHCMQFKGTEQAGFIFQQRVFKFIFQDKETVAAFLTEYCRVPAESVSKYKSPKDLVFELMEAIKMMDPGAAQLSAQSSSP